MKHEKYTLFFLLALLVVYFSQGALYQQGSLMSQVALFLILSISGFYFLKTSFDSRKKPLFYKAWSFLLVLNIVAYIFTADLSSSLQFGKFKGLLIITLPFYAIFYFSESGLLKAKHLANLFIVMLPIVIYQFYLEKASILSVRSWVGEGIVNNVSYMFVYFIPSLFLIRNKKLVAVICAFVLMFFIIQGAKRGALIAGIVGLLVFAYYQFKIIDRRHQVKGYILAATSVIFLIYYGYDYYMSNEHLVSRLSSIGDGGYSGRDIIYTNIFNSWYNSNNIFNILLGFGFGSSLVLSGTGNWAHNDWLEGLVGLGLLGVIVYATLFFSLGKLIVSRHLYADKRIAILAIALIWLFTTLVSMNYYNATNSVFQYIVLAYLIGSKTRGID